MVVDIILYITLVCELILLILILISIFRPDRRVWPPPGMWSGEYVVVWSLNFMVIGGIIVLGVLTWDTFIIGHWLLRAIGIILFVGGNALALWGLAELGLYASSGLEYKLVTSGPYKYTRNPQYLGDMVVLAGAILMVNSLYLIVPSLLGILLFGLLPFAEESWLREKYGEEYNEYCRRVPRFIGLPRGCGSRDAQA